MCCLSKECVVDADASHDERIQGWIKYLRPAAARLGNTKEKKREKETREK
jgi:hypothetical protein